MSFRLKKILGTMMIAGATVATSGAQAEPQAVPWAVPANASIKAWCLYTSVAKIGDPPSFLVGSFDCYECMVKGSLDLKSSKFEDEIPLGVVCRSPNLPDGVPLKGEKLRPLDKTGNNANNRLTSVTEMCVSAASKASALNCGNDVFTVNYCKNVAPDPVVTKQDVEACAKDAGALAPVLFPVNACYIIRDSFDIPWDGALVKLPTHPFTVLGTLPQVTTNEGPKGITGSYTGDVTPKVLIKDGENYRTPIQSDIGKITPANGIIRFPAGMALCYNASEHLVRPPTQLGQIAYMAAMAKWLDGSLKKEPVLVGALGGKRGPLTILKLPALPNNAAFPPCLKALAEKGSYCSGMLEPEPKDTKTGKCPNKARIPGTVAQRSCGLK